MQVADIEDPDPTLNPEVETWTEEVTTNTGVGNTET